jgi:hypothetical protein
VVRVEKFGVIAWLLFVAAVAPAFGTDIVATVDRNEVGVNESFRLTFEADDVTGTPDFSALQDNFEILDQSQNQTISITNGRTIRKLVWDVVLMAPREGVFQIPSISFGADRSQPITIVVKPGAVIKQDEKTIYLEVEADVEQPYVQQQVIFTVKLFRSVEVASATLSELEVEGVDAIVESFGEDQNYQMMRNGRRWLVVERKYLVFPQESGHMTIRPLQFRGRIVTRRTNLGFDIFNQRAGKPVALRSESVTLGVREPPASFTGPWLPAKRLELTESWPQNGIFTTGEPITRKITLRALGLAAAQLPELDLVLPEGLRDYPEQARLEDSGQAEGVLGTREQSLALIPTRPGTVTLPEIQVAWWNVDSQQPEIATLPARIIEVMAAATADPPPPAITGTSETSSSPVEADTSSGSSWELQSTPGWSWLSPGLALVWMLTLVLWWLDRRRSHRPAVTSEQVLTKTDPKQALRAIRSACDINDAPATKDALLKWGAAHWPESPPANLEQLGTRCGDPLNLLLRDLEQVLYGRNKDWDPARLLKTLRVFKPRAAGKKDSKSLCLEPMYRA